MRPKIYNGADHYMIGDNYDPRPAPMPRPRTLTPLGWAVLGTFAALACAAGILLGGWLT